MRQCVKRVISMLLVVVMLVSVLPVNAFAAEGSEETEPTVAAEPATVTEPAKDPVVPESSEPVVPESSEPAVPESSEPVVPESSEPVTPESSEPSEPEETSEPTEEPSEPEEEEDVLTMEALLEANPAATVTVYTQKIVDGAAQDLAETAAMTVGYVSDKAPAALGEGKTFAGAYAIVGGESKDISAVAVMDGERYVQAGNELLKLGEADLVVLKYTEAAEEIPMAPRRMARLKSGEQVALLDISYVSVFTQKVVKDVSLTPAAAGQIPTGIISQTASSVLGTGKTYLGAYVHKGGLDGSRYAVYAVEVDAEDESVRYVTTAQGQTGMTALETEDVIVIQYSEVPNTGTVTFGYTLDGNTLDPGASDFPLLLTNNLVDGKYDSDVALNIWLPRQIGYDYIEVESVTLMDADGKSVTAMRGENNLFTVSADDLKTLSGDLTAKVDLHKNLQQSQLFFIGANSLWIVKDDGSHFTTAAGTKKMDISCDWTEEHRRFNFTPYSNTVSFDMEAFLQWSGAAGNGKKLNKISINGVTLNLPDPTGAGNSATTRNIGSGYTAVVTITTPGDTRGEQWDHGAPCYTVTLTAPNGSLVHGDFTIATNYKDVDNSWEIWALQLDGVENIQTIRNSGGDYNKDKDSQGKDADQFLSPSGNGFWKRNNGSTTKIFAKIKAGYSWDSSNWDVSLLMSGTPMTLPVADNGDDYSKPCYYIEQSTGDVIINLPANMGTSSDDIRIIIKGKARNVQVKYDLNGGSWKQGESDPGQRLALTLDQYGFNLTNQVPAKTEDGQEMVFTGWKLDTGTEVYPSGAVYTTNETEFINRSIVDNAFTFTFVAQWVPKDQEHTTPYTIQVKAIDKDGKEVTVTVPTWKENGIVGKKTYLDRNKVMAKAGLDPDKYISVPSNVFAKDLQDNDTFDLLFVEEIHPEITVTKTADKEKAKPGEKVTYTITVKNTGDVAINADNIPEGITVSDGLTGTEIVSAEVTSGKGACDNTGKITALAKDAVVTVTVKYTIPDTQEPGFLKNTATATGTFVDKRPGSNEKTYDLKGSAEKTITIEQELRTLTASDLPAITYDGKAHLPESVLEQIKATVKDENDPSKEMVYGTDYDIVKKVQDHTTIAYTGDPTNVTETGVTVTIKGLGVYNQSSATVTYKITPAPLTITTGSDSKPYDGTPLTKEGVKVDGLVNDETLAAEATGTQTNAGTSSNGYRLDWDAKGTTAKQSNYKIVSETLGNLTVNKLKLTIKADDAKRPYNGMELTKDTYTVTGGTPAKGDFTVTVTGSQKDAGNSANVPAITYADGKADNYEITLANGTLTVTPAPLTIKTGSATKVWDGTALTNPEIHVTGLVDGEATCRATGSRTEVGNSKNTYEITWSENAKPSNYTITEKLGTLTVTETGTVVTKTHDQGSYKAGDTVSFTITVRNPYETAQDVAVTEQENVTITAITVNGESYSFTQSGTQVVVEGVPSKGVVVITAEYQLTPADGVAGSYKNEVTVAINGNSFTADDTVTVQKELKGENPEDVVYNGGEQKKAPVVRDKNDPTKILTEGTDYTLTYSANTINVGTVTITITGIGEYAGSNDTVTYQITKAPLILQVGSNSKKYDGQPLTEPSFAYVEGTKLLGQDKDKTITLNYPDSQTLVGEKPNTATIEDYGGVNADNYDITIKPGKLTVTDGTDTDPVDPDLVVTKTHDETKSYKENEEVTFTIEVTNIYDKEMKITLVEQDGMTMVKSDAPEGTRPANPLVFENVQPGATVTAIARYTITKADVENGTFSNTVTARFDGGKNFETTDTVKLTGLTVVKSLASINGSTDLTNAKVGDTVTYTITVTNNGDDALENVKVTDGLSTARISYEGDLTVTVNDNTCIIESLPGRGSVSLTVTYTVLDGDVPEFDKDVENSGNLVNKVTAKAGEDGPEGGDEEITPVARLEVTKVLNGGNQTVKVGGDITYTITVTNTGAVGLTNVLVEDSLETARIEGGSNTYRINSLAAGASKNLTVTYTVLDSDIVAGNLTNVATAKVPDGPEDQSEVKTPVSGLKVVKETTSTPANGTAYALEEIIKYTITVTNIGNETLTDITVTDELTGDTWLILSLEPGETSVFTTSHEVTQDDILAGKVVNVATAKTDDPNGPEGTGKTEDSTDKIATTLEVSKQADKEEAVEGEKVIYTITVKNTGNVDYKNVKVADGLTGAEITNVTAKNGYTTNDDGSVTLTKLEVEETATITVEYIITEADAKAGKVHNVATAKGDPIPDPAEPKNPKTPEGTAEEDVNTEPMNTALTVTKTADKDTAKAGETITYTITVKNDGNVDYKNVVVTDQFLAEDGETFVSGAAITKVVIGSKTVEVTDGSSSYTIDVLKKGETAIITAEYTVKDTDKGTITNVAIAKGETPDPDKVPEGGSDKVPTDVVFDLTVKKEWKSDSILTRPTSIKVTLYKDGQETDQTAELTALGGWKATFKDLNKDGSVYTVKETEVKGYAVKYSEMEDGTITVTNTKQSKPGSGLLQTGQLNWPIPVLAFLGISMITGGAALTIGKKKDSYEG